jgi:hypothetical protein
MKTKLTAPQHEALTAAHAGRLVRDESVGGRYRTKILGVGWVNHVVVTNLIRQRLIEIGPKSGVERMWLITVAGLAVLGGRVVGG